MAASLALATTSHAGDVPAGGSSSVSPASLTVSSAGSGSVAVHWAASCPNPSTTTSLYSWYVHIDAFHEDGSHAAAESAAVTNMASDQRTQRVPLQMAKGLDREAFSVQVSLSCYPNPPISLGEHSVLLVRKKSGTGGGTGGGGGGGPNGGGDGGNGGGDGTGGGGDGGGGAASAHCVVPKLVGKTLPRAKRLLRQAQCELGKVRRPRVGRTVRLVVDSSSPKAGTRLPKGARVDLTLRRARAR